MRRINRRAKGARPTGSRPPRFVMPVMAALDANGDGILDETEVANASAALKKLDKNHDGKIDREELRPPRPEGTPLPRSIGAPATRALRAAGLTSLESLGAVTEADLLAMHGVGPVAIARLREALADAGLGYARP